MHWRRRTIKFLICFLSFLWNWLMLKTFPPSEHFQYALENRCCKQTNTSCLTNSETLKNSRKKSPNNKTKKTKNENASTRKSTQQVKIEKFEIIFRILLINFFCFSHFVPFLRGKQLIRQKFLVLSVKIC